MNKNIKRISGLAKGCILAVYFTLGGMMLAFAIILLWLFS